MNDDPVRFEIEEMQISGGRRLHVYVFEDDRATEPSPATESAGVDEGPQVSSSP